MLEFNSQDILVASSATSLGNVKLGGAWFVAFRYKGVVGGNNANNYGPFGHGTSSNRFGFYQGWDGFCLCYYGSGFSLQSNWRFDTDADIVSCATFRPTAGSYNANIQGWRKDPVNNDPIVTSPAVSRQKSAAKPSGQRGKYGIMRDVKKNAKRALIFAAAIAGGMAAPMRSDESVRKVQTSLVPIHALLCAESRHCA